MEDQNNLNSIERKGSCTKAFKGFKPLLERELSQSAQKPLGSDAFINVETQTLRLKNSLENWREIVLLIHSVILWEKSWYPAAIFGGTSFIFLSVWLLDPSVLTTVSILGLTITISDYFVPYVTATIFKPDLWSISKEKTFGEFCRATIMYKITLGTFLTNFYLMRTTRPKMYYGSTVLVLALLAWIGNSFNNLLLTYILLTILLLIPGTERHGVLKKYITILRQKLSEYTIIKGVESKKEQ